MASIINKIRDKVETTLDSRNNNTNNPHSTNSGPHSSNLMNNADPYVDSDRDHRNDPVSHVGGYGSTQTHDTYGATGGLGSHVTSTHHGSHVNEPAYDNSRSSNAGPHSSNLLNKLDPRTDSDRDHRNDPTSRVGGVGHTQQYGDGYGQAGGAGVGAMSDTSYGTHTHTGHSHTGHTGHGVTSHHATTTGGYDASSAGYDNPQSTNAGPHRSNFANKLDPRTDSDRDHRNDPTSRVGGYGTQTENYGYNTGNQGGYLATDGMGGHGHSSHTPGSGTATRTAGPHNSDLMNKLDPRVDSDMDGSKTYGGNQTRY